MPVLLINVDLIFLFVIWNNTSYLSVISSYLFESLRPFERNKGLYRGTDSIVVEAC